ncbi:hypothetical protein H0B56_10250 [Haloechinothrix sp. YIM 98757]|uniref:Actinobacteria/chloroflexi VLRF1 release factor domain-containing protein n=1 Tax=Haloechinothrix aidingensis TaxID=2752311 RepID=A0A838AA46_9PSEU|nr:hypothetical protein [Haloechinothrix aidingensis]
MKARQVAGGGRAVEVPPERLRRWFDNFAARNGGIRDTRRTPEAVTVTGGNGTTATATVPFAPLPPRVDGHASVPGLAVDELVEHACRERRIGLILVRAGAHSVGIADGDSVVASRTDRHHVQGRTSAGGWSQQRFARRRQGQARQALRRAADDVAEVVLAEVERLDAVILGGDRAALDELRADSRLRPALELVRGDVLDVPEPRRRVLDEAAVRARAVEIVITDPDTAQG